MKSIRDPSFYYSQIEIDLERTFERVWRELDEREEAESTSGSSHSKVRLKCDDQLADIASVELIGLRDFGPTLLIQFICPRCGRRHESPQLP
ncbi:MAG TPA: hypothetical protein VML56_10950 [Burkholderiales bacterium]|nr:hypothetical protein [Burkholderiales bacterium]